jgi:hypothetical protein
LRLATLLLADKKLHSTVKSVLKNFKSGTEVVKSVYNNSAKKFIKRNHFKDICYLDHALRSVETPGARSDVIYAISAATSTSKLRPKLAQLASIELLR